MTPDSWHKAAARDLETERERWGRRSGLPDRRRQYLSPHELNRALDAFRYGMAKCTCGILWFTTHGYHRTKPPFDSIEDCPKHGMIYRK